MLPVVVVCTIDAGSAPHHSLLEFRN